MTNNIRVFLWLGLALAVWLNYSQWQVDYGPKPVAAAKTVAADGTKIPSMEDTVPRAAQTPATTPAAEGTVPTPPGANPAIPAVIETAGTLHVTTDVLDLDIDLKGG